MTSRDFYKNTRKEASGCWIWTKGLQHGYGSLRVGRRNWRAHRYSWTLKYGKIPMGLHVLHHCDTPACVNPKHLFTGTHTDNMQDKLAKGRDHNQKKTRCPKGHLYSYVDPSGSRKCRKCVLASGRSHYWRNVETIRKRKRLQVLAYYHRNREAIIAKRARLRAERRGKCSVVN